MKKNIVFIFLIPCWISSFAQIDSAQVLIDSLEASLHYQQGEIKLKNDLGTLIVPDGFRYLDGKQSRYVLEDLWGNPEDTVVMGMIVPENTGVLGDNSWAFIITYDEMGYVKDDDAGEIDYDELLDEMKADSKGENEFREKEGYEPIEFVGWASKPFYDEDKKVLHWAKEIKFGDNEYNTLNYNVRILGRKGVMIFNAVAPMGELSEVQKSITPVLASFTYADGAKYKDFDPELDDVAAWTIGGLVAGKVLAKVGILALLLKYIKVIAIAVGALGTAVWRWYKKKTELPAVRTLDDSNSA
jgi:uncharacterized membrane-anchored protein